MPNVTPCLTSPRLVPREPRRRSQPTGQHPGRRSVHAQRRPGLVAFDLNDHLHTINWQTFIVGIQYYCLPGARLHQRKLQSGKVKTISESLSSQFAHAAVGEFLGGISVFAVRRMEHLLRHNARHPDGLFLSTGRSESGRRHERPQQSLRADFSPFPIAGRCCERMNHASTNEESAILTDCRRCGVHGGCRRPGMLRELVSTNHGGRSAMGAPSGWNELPAQLGTTNPSTPAPAKVAQGQSRTLFALDQLHPMHVRRTVLARCGVPERDSLFWQRFSAVQLDPVSGLALALASTTD